MKTSKVCFSTLVAAIVLICAQLMMVMVPVGAEAPALSPLEVPESMLFADNFIFSLPDETKVSHKLTEPREIKGEHKAYLDAGAPYYNGLETYIEFNDVFTDSTAYVAYKVKNNNTEAVCVATVLYFSTTSKNLGAGVLVPLVYDAETGEKLEVKTSYEYTTSKGMIWAASVPSIELPAGKEVYVAIPMSSIDSAEGGYVPGVARAVGEEFVKNQMPQKGILWSSNAERTGWMSDYVKKNGYGNLKQLQLFITGNADPDKNDRKYDGSFDLTVSDVYTVSKQDYLTSTYTIADEWISFIQAEDTNYVTLGEGGSWELVENEGAIGGQALACKTKADNASGDGIKVKFSVPADGIYQIWGRAYYADQLSNSLHYAVDGGDSKVWDFADEDAPESECYKSWQYFYLTERTEGTFEEGKYGSFTVANGKWYHSPNALELKAGNHEITITGREAGVILDEIVITTCTVEMYDPNAFEGNEDLLDVCKFCGENKHYCSDNYAQTGVTAEEYLLSIAPDVKIEAAPLFVTSSDEGGNDEGDNGGDNEQGGSQGGNNQGDDNETPSIIKPSGNKPSGNKPSDNTATDGEFTTAPATEEESGCASTVSVATVLMLGMLGGAMLFKKRKD